MKSSPKIILHPKPAKNKLDRSASTDATSPSIPQASNLQPAKAHPSLAQLRGTKPASPQPVSATWICSICSFSNPVPSNFDATTATASTNIPPCLACGIKPPLATILKAAISAATKREPAVATPPPPVVETPPPPSVNESQSDDAAGSSVACPRCTFVNHPSLFECEICGAPLAAVKALKPSDGERRAESPAPFFGQDRIKNTDTTESMKLSFRAGSEKAFHERLKSALIQRKWLLYDAPPVPTPSQAASSPSLTATAGTSDSPTRSLAGIAGLERRGLEARKNNEVVIGNAFEDLEALMASAKQIVSLAETLGRESGMASDNETSAETNAVLSESAAALGMSTTKDMLGSNAENLYLSELSRNLAEYLTDDRKGILHREGGTMSLIDLWAVFNRARNGVELVSPSDFQRAAELWEKLRLPVRLRRFKTGLLVVQRYDWSDEKTLALLQDWMDELRHVAPPEPVAWDWRLFGRSVTAQEAAQRFQWSVGVAAEELEMAEDRGVLCREAGIEGLRFWSNHIGSSSEWESDSFID